MIPKEMHILLFLYKKLHIKTCVSVMTKHISPDSQSAKTHFISQNKSFNLKVYLLKLRACKFYGVFFFFWQIGTLSTV